MSAALAGRHGSREGVRWRLERHDRDRIELKLEYDRPPKGRRAHFRVDLFFFIPPNLGISPRHYDKEDFFEDLQTYVRYRAPTLSLGSLADFKAEHHPLAPVLAWVEAGGRPGPQTDAAKVTHALKLYGAALIEAMDEERKFLRDQTHPIGDQAAESMPRLCSAETLERTERFVEAVEENLSAFRRLRVDLLVPRLDPQVGAALVGIDEYISLEAEEALFKILSLIRVQAQRDGALSDRTRGLIRKEISYRASLGLPSRVSPDAEDTLNEAYQYRHGVLKKFAASSLFLDLRGSRVARRAKEIIAAVAAGLAMTFALIVAVASTRYAQWSVYSLKWIVVAVVAYIFKDRIKEWIRTVGASQLSRWLSDRRATLRDESFGRSVGTVCETHRYIHPDRVERSVRNIRMADPFSRLELEHGDERVMRYTREIRLRGDDEQAPLTDILRYDFDRYTKRMDDPLEPVSVLADDGNVRVVMTPRIYRVNLLLRITDLQAGPDSSVHTFVRVVLTSKGIRRLEFAS